MKWAKRDRYRRIVGFVIVDGHDVNLAQVKAGMAWFYRYDQKELSTENRKLYAQAEDEARANNKGLWQDKNPMPPWEWRRLREIMCKPSIVALPCNDMTYTTTRIVYITFSPGYQVYVTVKDRLPRRLTVINADVVTGDRGIGLIDHISHFLQ